MLIVLRNYRARKAAPQEGGRGRHNCTEMRRGRFEESTVRA